MNILVIRLKSIGDVVLTLPAVNALRDNYPDARIVYLTSSENAGLIAGFQEVNEVISLDRRSYRTGNPLTFVPQFFRLLRRLRTGRFDLAIDFQNYGETAWLARLTGARRRLGITTGENRRWAYTVRMQRDHKVHHVDRNLALLRAGGLTTEQLRNNFKLPQSAQLAAREFLQSKGVDMMRPILFVQPFTSSPQKDWQLENYLAVAAHWQAHCGPVIFGGGPNDRGRLQSAIGDRFCISAGVPLLVTGGLMQLSRLVLGGDTGGVYLAMALGRRVVMIIYSKTLDGAGPYQHRDWAVTTRPGEQVQSITVLEVIAACERGLGEPAA